MDSTTAYAPDSRYAWFRLLISLVLAIVGGIGLWLVVVVIPTIQTEFGIDRAGASLPYTVTFIGFAFGGYTMGRDRVKSVTTSVEPAPRVIFVSQPQTPVEFTEPRKEKK